MQITAPYGFVPLTSDVECPVWLKPVVDGEAPPLHDIPFKEGICGTLELEIEAETPIFIRATKESPEPFKLAGRGYAIPGTALRGALRNVVEIITFSRFQRVNDHRYAVRDLHNRELYGQHMAAIEKDVRTGKGEPMPLVNAGWLTGDEENGYQIEVCDFAKIEYRDLMKQSPGFNPGHKQSSAKKYANWKGSLNVNVRFEVKRPNQVGRRPMDSRFGKAVLDPKGQPGTLVFTGQPSMWRPDQPKRAGAGNPKHHDFVFLKATTPQTIKVPLEVFEDFEFAHSDRGQQNRLGKSQTPNEEWGYWDEQRRRDPKARVPVFFLKRDNGSLRAFGLAMMFRLGYEHSVGQAIDGVSGDHRALEGGLDFSEGLFGTVRDRRKGRSNEGVKQDDQALALKGRVGISHAVAVGTPQLESQVSAILGAPKASYYPNYVEQTGGNYQTFMDPGAKPRGWKRYRALTHTWNPKPPTGSDGRALDASKVGTTFRPLQAGTRFVAHVDVHNLLPQELGALLWAIDFGQDEKARHTLGMARPLGYGRCKLSVRNPTLVDNQGNKVDLGACRQRFEDYMEKESKLKGRWKNSFQLKELRALAQPVHPDQAKYQRLDPGARTNEFIEAKKARLSLPYASGQYTPPASSGGARPSGGGPARAGAPAVSSMLAVGQTVQGVLLEEKTKKGGWKARAGGSIGPILNTSAVPSDAQPGQEVKLKVRATNARESNFEFLP